jgi:hypothetical protein
MNKANQIFELMLENVQRASDELQSEACTAFIKLLEKNLIKTDAQKNKLLSVTKEMLESWGDGVLLDWALLGYHIVASINTIGCLNEIINHGVSLGEVSQPITTRVCSARLLGKILTLKSSMMIQKPLKNQKWVDKIYGLCRDFSWEVKVEISKWLGKLGKLLDQKQIEEDLMPIILDLTEDEEGVVASHAIIAFRKVLK